MMFIVFIIILQWAHEFELTNMENIYGICNMYKNIKLIVV